MHYHLIYFVVVLLVTEQSFSQIAEMSSLCIPLLEFTTNPVGETKQTNIECKWNFDECYYDYVVIEKEINFNYEIAMKFEDNGKFEGFKLSNLISYKNSSRIGGVSVPGVFGLVIHQAVLEDGGDWRCTLVYNGNHTSYPDTLIVYSDLTNVSITIDPPDFIILGTPHEYTCSAYTVSPKLDVVWGVNGENRNGTSTDVDGGYYWDIINTLENTLYKDGDYSVSCTMKTSIGNRTEQAPSVGIFVPTGLENTSLPNLNPTPEYNFTMSCTVSGSSPVIDWHHNDSDVDASMFTRTNEIIMGDFPFGESHALRSTLVWIVPDESKWCEKLDKFSGTYQCTGNSIKGPPVSSKIASVFLQYGPIILGRTETVLYAKVGTEVQMTCARDCASPDVLTYTWTSEHNREGIDKDMETISIVITDLDFNVTFTCIMNNTVGSIKRTFMINNTDEVTGETTTVESTTEPPTTEKRINESPNQTLVTAFAVIWSLCGVFAILLVCLAWYHYRQIQDGKKYQGEYSEELVLTEDEAAPGTSQGFGLYDDISPASVVNKGSLSGAIGGVSNEGLYAEVQIPAQSQMPVAPKRTSKIQSSQPNLGSPKTKRTQAPAAPKSPMNTRHQPNSPSTGRRPEPKADYSPVSTKKEIQKQHPNESNPASKTDQHPKKHESPNKTAAVMQTTNGAKPSIPFKPNITSVRSSRSSTTGAPYDNAQVNMYANCDQRPIQKNDDGTITYADLALQQEDPYDEGAPPVPAKNINDQEPVQYASIKHGS